MDKLCPICGERVGYKYVFCNGCYTTYYTAIRSNSVWVTYLENEERRRRRKPTLHLIFLGDTLDVTEDGRLVFR